MKSAIIIALGLVSCCFCTFWLSASSGYVLPYAIFPRSDIEFETLDLEAGKSVITCRVRFPLLLKDERARQTRRETLAFRNCICSVAGSIRFGKARCQRIEITSDVFSIAPNSEEIPQEIKEQDAKISEVKDWIILQTNQHYMSAR